jgi:membrane-bound lytic murein transglycosylase D
MQWKTIFCAVLITAPFIVGAQTKVISSNNRPLAMLSDKDGADLIVIAPGSKVVSPDSLVIPTANPFKKEDPVIVVGAKAKTTVKDITAEKAAESEPDYKHVPLIGELDYYGNMNSYMVKYCKSYMSNFSRRLNSVNAKEKTFAVMESVLEKYNIPKELKYLAVIESALNGNARSPVGAVGYWQFMAPTARLMGLTVSRHRDDRRDLYKSTVGAAKYLSYLYDRLDDWLLVIAAYNSGPRPVLNAIKRTGKNDFWTIKKYLPKETQNHVLAFVATATIMERLNNYIEPGLPDDFDWASLNHKHSDGPAVTKIGNATSSSRFTTEELKSMALVRINKPLNLEVVASVLSIDRRKLGRWNYDYFEFIDNYQAGNTYNFRIPKDKLDQFIEQKNYLEKTSANYHY